MITFSKKTWGEIYYTLDGTAPEDGEKYTGSIKIETSDFPVTVMARQKFWWVWDNLVEAEYREARESDGANSGNSEGLLNAYNLNASSGFKLQTLKETLTIDSYVSNVKTER